MKRCSSCKKLLDSDLFQKDRAQCKRCRKLYMVSRYKQRVNNHQCGICGKILNKNDKSSCGKCKAKARSKWSSNTCRYKIRQRERRRNLKIMALKAYGGVSCRCCSENHIEFLTIDHINGGGGEHRRELGRKYAMSFYRWLRDNNYPPGYQVLCYSCNLAKGHFGVCPHELERKQIRSKMKHIKAGTTINYHGKRHIIITQRRDGLWYIVPRLGAIGYWMHAKDIH